MIFTSNTRRQHYAKDPAVVRFQGKYYLYYSVPGTAPADEDGWEPGWSVGIAVSEDLENWREVGFLEPSQECDKKGLAAPGAIVLDGKVHLFYQSYGNGKRDAICHAVSSNGVDFEKDASNPVYSPRDSWCCGRAIDADACLFHDKLFLYFATRDHEMRVQKQGVAVADRASGFSNGSFQHACTHSILHPELKWEGECIEAAATIVENGRLYLFYGGSYNCTPQQIGCAVSDDGIHFERVSETPLLPCGSPGDFNASESGHPFAFRDEDGSAWLFYQGSPDGGKSWYLSKARIVWEGETPRLIPDIVPDRF